MPVERGRSPSRIVRLARVRRGTATVRCLCAPRFDHARATHELALANGAATFTATSGTGLRLTTSAPLRKEGMNVVAEQELAPGEKVAFVLEGACETGSPGCLDARWAARSL